MLETEVWDARSEKKHEAYRRLEDEGRWDAFRERKKEVKKERRDLEGDGVFYATLAEFPPLAVPDDSPQAIVEPAEAPALSEGGVDLTEAPEADDAELLERLETDADVPMNVEQQIAWAQRVLAAYQDADNRKDRDRMREIELQCPVNGGVSMLRAAVSNPNKFNLEVVPKFLLPRKDESGEDRQVRGRIEDALSVFEEILTCQHCGGTI